MESGIEQKRDPGHSNDLLITPHKANLILGFGQVMCVETITGS